MIYPIPREESHPVFAVVDREDPDARWIVDAVGSDAVELESALLIGPPCHPRVRVKVLAFTPRQLAAICRYLAALHRPDLTEAGAFFEAVHGRGISIGLRGCYVCHHPEEGREFFAARARDRKGGGS